MRYADQAHFLKLKGKEMYQKILAPLDGSEFSECSLKHVIGISTACHVPEVVLLTVAEPIHRIPGFSEDWHRNAEREAVDYSKKYLLKLVDDLKESKVSAQAVVIEGQPAEVILDYANSKNVDLIIMSTHGRSGGSRWVFGSVTDRVLRHSKVPILTISPPGCRTG